MQVNHHEGMRAGEMALPPASGSIEWPSQSNPEKSSLVVQIKKELVGQHSLRVGFLAPCH